ncbi:MAG: hypothetical protein NUV75_10505 [Gallionella sp.]|nr:hypothetical protein [Gallionella sp.]
MKTRLFNIIACFQKLTVERELHMKKLVEENAALRDQLAPDQPASTWS